jgi:hypothetical protein
MDCPEFLTRYSDYDDSLLSAPELERFRAHLSRCASCARYDRVLRKGRMLARQRSSVDSMDHFMPRLQRRLWQDRTRRRRSAGPVLGGAATALAAVTVVLTALWGVSLLDRAVEAEMIADTPIPLVEPPSLALDHAVVVEAGWHVLPVVDRSPPRDWAAYRVDPRASVAYSPLVTGPPAYRVPGAFTANNTVSTRHTFD